MRGFLKQPLVQFLLAGFVVALIAQWRGPSGEADSDEIVVTEDRVQAIASEFAQTWHRLPEPDEIDRLIANYVREEALVREAARLGLADDDQIVRRRLTSKMEELLSSEAQVESADEDQLQRYFEKHWQDFANPTAYSIDQIFLGEEEAAAQAAAVKARGAIKAGGDWRKLGSPLPLPGSYADKTSGDIERALGADFARSVEQAKPGEWAGPLRSAYGYHLLRVNAATPPQKPDLAAKRKQVEAAWRKQAIEESKAQAVAEILDGYTVTIRKPE